MLTEIKSIRGGLFCQYKYFQAAKNTQAKIYSDSYLRVFLLDKTNLYDF